MYINDTKIDGRKRPYNQLVHYNRCGRDAVRLIEYKLNCYRFFGYADNRLTDASLEDVPLDIIKALDIDNPNLIPD